MQVLSITELMRLTRTELTDLLVRTTGLLANLREDAPERAILLMNIATIRSVLARRDFAP